VEEEEEEEEEEEGVHANCPLSKVRSAWSVRSENSLRRSFSR
jgi:hypothetical protein